MATDLVNPISGITPSQLSQPFTRGSAVATTSGTAVDITGFPSWARIIILSFAGISTNGTSLLELRIGSGSVDSTGYDSVASFGVAGGQFVSSTSGFVLTPSTAASAAALQNGSIILFNSSGNVWQSQSNISAASSVVCSAGSGLKSLGGTLDRVRLTTQGGTDTFDAGSITPLYL